MSKALVAFFSATGITAKLAKELAEAIHADLYEIKPKTPYTTNDLNWVNPFSRTMKEYIGKTMVAIAGQQRGMDEYDTIIVGFPIWFLKEPNIIRSFITQYDFAGKTMACFATSHKAGVDKAVSDLKSLCPNAEWKGGLLVKEDKSAELMEWANRIIKNSKM